MLVVMSGQMLTLFGQSLFVGSIALSLYGVYVARQLKVKNVVVKITHMPDAWQKKKIAWISDVHLGQIYGKEYAQKIVDMVKEINPEVLCVGGDLFDGTTAPDCRELVSPFQELTKVMPV